jgi:hypothetical protein
MFTFDRAALSVWLAATSCLSRLDKMGLSKTGNTREDTGESCTRPVMMMVVKLNKVF